MIWRDKIQLSKYIQGRLICPKTQIKLKEADGYLENIDDPTLIYPIVNDVPILINEENSLFCIEDFYVNNITTINHKQDLSPLLKGVQKLTPSINRNFKAKDNYRKLVKLLPDGAKILVVGGSVKGCGIDVIYSALSFEVVGADVSFGPYTQIIFDAHDIPFMENTFDCVIVQAVLEHVLDPHRCVSELYRILKKDGLVYSETPFMQQVHMRQYDFTRFTYLGHRRLFRNFEEIESGPIAGPGTALAWSYTYFLRSFSTSKKVISLLTKTAYFTSFFLKYFDFFLINKAGSYDAASAFYFIGRKSCDILSDKDLLKLFKGVN